MQNYLLSNEDICDYLRHFLFLFKYLTAHLNLSQYLIKTLSIIYNFLHFNCTFVFHFALCLGREAYHVGISHIVKYDQQTWL